MIKRLPNVEVFEFANYKVLLERIKNSSSGNPRFEATIISKSQDVNTCARFRFSGHYTSEREEAEFILGEFLKFQ